MDDSLDLGQLQRRTSAKWRYHPQDVIPAWVAEMDVDLAGPVAEALLAAVRRSDTGYPWPGELPQALIEFAGTRWGWVPEASWVTVIPDVVVGICEALQALTGPGESVVITPPVYPPFFSSAERVGRTIAEVPMLRDEDGRYRLDLPGLERAFAHREVTAFVLCNPHNPTGSVPTREELARIDELAVAHRIVVISDEIHGPLAHPGVTFVPYLTVASEESTAVSLISASKAFNLAGLKCAQLVAGSDSMAALIADRVPDEVTYGAGNLGVLASIAAYREGGAWLDETLRQIADRSVELSGLLMEHLPQVRYRPPQASYLAWLDCRLLGLGDDPAATFLERGRVALSPGPDFGAPGAGFARLNFATTSANLREIVARMALSL